MLALGLELDAALLLLWGLLKLRQRRRSDAPFRVDASGWWIGAVVKLILWWWWTIPVSMLVLGLVSVGSYSDIAQVPDDPLPATEPEHFGLGFLQVASPFAAGEAPRVFGELKAASTIGSGETGRSTTRSRFRATTPKRATPLP